MCILLQVDSLATSQSYHWVHHQVINPHLNSSIIQGVSLLYPFMTVALPRRVYVIRKMCQRTTYEIINHLICGISGFFNKPRQSKLWLFFILFNDDNYYKVRGGGGDGLARFCSPKLTFSSQCLDYLINRLLFVILYSHIFFRNQVFHEITLIF